MAGTRNKNEPAKNGAGKSTKSPPAPAEDPNIEESGDIEDGDITTPKRDSYGTDDEPLW